jgi:ABC-2 type transport system ATP-binding protein
VPEKERRKERGHAKEQERLPEAERVEGQSPGLYPGANQEMPRGREETSMRPETWKGMTLPPGAAPDDLIRVVGLCRSYGSVRALDNVSFSVRRGEVFGYLGPNGAGKTTTINILCGLLQRDSGEVHVCGLDIARDPIAVKQRIGVVPEESNLYPEITCRRNLEYLGELYGLSRIDRCKRTDDLLQIFGLADRANALFRTLSRGMKRRLTMAAALIHSPEVLFLDEPTAGLDVPSARALRSLIRAISRDGTTVFLTTHNLSEAETLCHRVLILVKGQVVAQGTSEQIRRRVEKARSLTITLSGEVTREALRKACGAVQSATVIDGTWRLEVSDAHEAIAQVLAFAGKEGLRVVELATATPTLEDAFMTILTDESRGKKGGV